MTLYIRDRFDPGSPYKRLTRAVLDKMSNRMMIFDEAKKLRLVVLIEGTSFLGLWPRIRITVYQRMMGSKRVTTVERKFRTRAEALDWLFRNVFTLMVRAEPDNI